MIVYACRREPSTLICCGGFWTFKELLSRNVGRCHFGSVSLKLADSGGGAWGWGVSSQLCRATHSDPHPRSPSVEYSL